MGTEDRLAVLAVALPLIMLLMLTLNPENAPTHAEYIRFAAAEGDAGEVVMVGEVVVGDREVLKEPRYDEAVVAKDDAERVREGPGAAAEEGEGYVLCIGAELGGWGI